MAEQIHDGPLQDLTAISLKLAAMQRAGHTDIRQDILEVEALVQSVTRDLRGIIDASYVDAVCSDLPAQLTELARSFRSQSGLECEVAIHAEHAQLQSDLSDVIYRSVGELLTNVRKHARASRVVLSSAFDDDGNVTFRVCDNGIGLPTFQWRGTPFEGGGFGLWSIEHALSSYGGLIRIDGSDGLDATIVLPRRLLITR